MGWGQSNWENLLVHGAGLCSGTVRKGTNCWNTVGGTLLCPHNLGYNGSNSSPVVREPSLFQFVSLRFYCRTFRWFCLIRWVEDGHSRRLKSRIIYISLIFVSDNANMLMFSRHMLTYRTYRVYHGHCTSDTDKVKVKDSSSGHIYVWSKFHVDPCIRDYFTLDRRVLLPYSC